MNSLSMMSVQLLNIGSAMKSRFLIVAACLAALNGLADNGNPLSEAEILKRVTYPPEFEATVFASPPQLSYPIFLSAAPDGSLFVGCDENGSLDQKGDRGRVVLLQDTQGTGHADKITTFAKMDSPRGVAWDGSTRTLYVMHPPFLTAYHDDQGTGVANRQEDLITGLGFPLSARGADHTINGIRLGIDGWIYIACGDYGAALATGRDGRSLSLRGGGILRVRPDGSGLETVVKGTRNILAVAIAPTLDLFTRDNTNDGDDWNDRLSFNPFGAQMGYPTLFRNFADETIPTMIDYGGGSPVGAIFIDEPVLPKAWAHGFYSVEWGRNEIDLHPLTHDGATWKADTRKFMSMTRATDLEVDGKGNLYAASLDGATFTYNGPVVGYVVRLRPKGLQAPTPPDFKKLTPAQLVEAIGSGSGVWRLAAQREFLSRGAAAGGPEGLVQVAAQNPNLGARVAALFTLRQAFGVKSIPLIRNFLAQDDLREYALKAIADSANPASVGAEIPVAPFLEALKDTNPRVRLQAVTALGRSGRVEVADALLPHTADPDYTVAHIAVHALRWLKASDASLRALDQSSLAVRKGALRVLQALYEPDVVQGLISRLATADPELRRGVFQALCRLDTQEAPYTGLNMWWGTRPDTSGPLYLPIRWELSDTIETALRGRLEASSGEEAREQVATLLKTKVSFPGMTELALAKAGKDTGSRLDVIAPLLSPKTPTSPDVVKALSAIATAPTEDPVNRARAFRMLRSVMDKNFDAVIGAVAPLARIHPEPAGTTPLPGPLVSVWEEFTRDAGMGNHIGQFRRLAENADPAHRVIGSTVLVNLATSTVIKDERVHKESRAAIAALWSKPDAAATLLSVVGSLRAAEFAPQVNEQVNSTTPAVAEAARYAQTQLGLSGSGTDGRLIAALPYEEVVKTAIATPGEAKVGEQLFLQQGCVVCHTVSPKDPPKGPMLGGIATRYNRTELCESILKPSAKIAQGFEPQSFTLKDGDQVDGFVVKESGDSVEVRNAVGAVTVIEKGDLAKREKLAQSIMPEGLVANLTPVQLGSLLAYLESTSAK